MAAADYTKVRLFPLNGIVVPGRELVSGATASGRGSTMLAIEPDNSQGGWKKLPRLGEDYLIDAKSPTGGHVQLVASCTSAPGRRDPAEFLVRWKV